MTKGIVLEGGMGSSSYSSIGYASGGGGGAGIHFSRGGGYGTNISFTTNSTGTQTPGALTERMRITDAGNVGIGTAAPNARLEIVGATAAQAEALRVIVGATGTVGVRVYEDLDQPYFLRFRSISVDQKGFIFSGDNDSTILTVQSATDRVGIGTSTPTQALDVVGGIITSGGITAAGTIVTSGGITATGSITPGAWANGSAPRSYISTVAPAAGASFPTAGSIWFVV